MVGTCERRHKQHTYRSVSLSVCHVAKILIKYGIDFRTSIDINGSSTLAVGVATPSPTVACDDDDWLTVAVAVPAAASC